MTQTKEKVQKSKLSFYVTIELELFPGTSVNMLQKNTVKCQSTFERVRESWSDIFGFQYRKAPMIEAYAYNYQKKNTQKEDNKKTQKYKQNKQNKTQKYKQNKIQNINNL